MKKTILPCVVLILAMTTACQQTAKAPKGHAVLLEKFHPMEAKDTMHFEVTHDADNPGQHSDTIPNPLFFSSLDTAWLRAIDYLADSTESTIYAEGRFPLAQGVEACIADIHYNWFRNLSLLVYDQQRQAFTDRITVGEWYGGDGGQALIGSWLLDVDGDGDKDLVVRQIDHSMTVQDDGEPMDHTYESARLLLWQDGKFSEKPIADTLAYVKRFPIESAW